MFFAFFMLCLRREWWRVYVGLQRTRMDTYGNVSDISGCVYEQARASYNAIRCFFLNKTRLDLHCNWVKRRLPFRWNYSARREHAHTPYDIRAEWVPRMSGGRWTRNREGKRGSILPYTQWRSSGGREPRRTGHDVMSRFVMHDNFDMHIPDKINTALSIDKGIKELCECEWILTILEIARNGMTVLFFRSTIIYISYAAMWQS